jgi:hypothetical protein
VEEPGNPAHPAAADANEVDATQIVRNGLG